MLLTNQTLIEVMAQLRQQLECDDCVIIKVPSPLLHDGSYGACEVEIEGRVCKVRTMRQLSDLAQALGCSIAPLSFEKEGFMELRLKKIAPPQSLTQGDMQGRYGKQSKFWEIAKLEEPDFLSYYIKALELVEIRSKRALLCLGVYKGDELEPICAIAPQAFEQMRIDGVDYCEDAIKEAKRRFGAPRRHFHCEDINNLEALGLPCCDLLVSIGTLQSRDIRYKELLMKLVQKQLCKEEGAIILGFPNCQWSQGEMIYGARAAHYNFSELSNNYNDVMFAKRYLQQHRYRVMIIGKSYIFVVARKLKKRNG